MACGNLSGRNRCDPLSQCCTDLCAFRCLSAPSREGKLAANVVLDGPWRTALCRISRMVQLFYHRRLFPSRNGLGRSPGEAWFREGPHGDESPRPYASKDIPAPLLGFACYSDPLFRLSLPKNKRPGVAVRTPGGLLPSIVIRGILFLPSPRRKPIRAAISL